MVKLKLFLKKLMINDDHKAWVKIILRITTCWFVILKINVTFLRRWDEFIKIGWSRDLEGGKWKSTEFTHKTSKFAEAKWSRRSEKFLLAKNPKRSRYNKLWNRLNTRNLQGCKRRWNVQNTMRQDRFLQEIHHIFVSTFSNLFIAYFKGKKMNNILIEKTVNGFCPSS